MSLVLAGLLATFLFAQWPDEAQVLVEKGAHAFQGRDFRTAEQCFSRAAKLRPGDPRIWKVLGMSYAAEDRPELAEPAFRRACNLNPREENACYYLGRALFTTARFREAIDSFRLALTNAGNQRGRVLLGMALTYERMGETAKAETSYKDAIAAGEKQAQIDYGLFLSKEGRAEEGIVVLRKAGATEELARVQKQLDATKASGRTTYFTGDVKFDRAELPMVVRNGATGLKYLPETMLAGVAVFDYDNDGWADIYICNGATLPGLQRPDSSWSNRLFRNNHDGTFTDQTVRAGIGGSGYSMGVAAGDFDNDGNVDLFVTGLNASTLYRNRGDGTFEDVTNRAQLHETSKWSVAAAWLDFDNDGLLDLLVVRYVQWDPQNEMFCGSAADEPAGVAGYRQYCTPRFYRPMSNALYRNLGGGKFQDVSESSGVAKHWGKGMGVSLADYDGDGKMDFFVANDTVPNFLFHNDGLGKFSEQGLSAGVALNADGKPISSMGADFRDLDNDGREDLFVTALSNETFPVFHNRGSGEFADITYPSGIGKLSFPWTGWSNGAFDFNNDGWKDLFVAGGHVMDNAELSSGRPSRQPNLVFLNEGGHFRMQTLSGEALHRGAAFADLDHDGRVDVVITRLNETPVVLFNRTEPRQNWIRFRLVGRKSNRDGIGARIHITYAGFGQWNHVTTSVGYACSSEPVVHFGVGSADIVDSAQIRWPSGIVQTMSHLRARQLYTVQEPEQAHPQ